MVNTTHLKVLLKKDFLTLWRNKGFLLAFAILPIGLMIAFAYIQSLVDNGLYTGNLVDEYFRYVSNQYEVKPPGINKRFMDVPPAVLDDQGFPSQVYSSDIGKCKAQNQGKYYFSKVAVISGDEDVQTAAQTYF